jgi:hypothetical protein
MPALLLRSVVAVALVAIPRATVPVPDPVYDPLHLYEGTWVMTPARGGAAVTITNDCGRIGRFYGCQQTVNGKTGGVILFIPRDTVGRYFTQAVAPDGRAMGRGELTIAGPHWEYLGHDGEGDSVEYFRTTNDFTGRDRIHFELATSHDGANWTVTQSGDEVRKR